MTEEGMLHTVADVMPMFVAYVDSDRRYRFVNKAYAERFGLRTDQILGHPIEEILGASMYETLRPYIDSALAGKHTVHKTLVEFPDGQRQWLSATLVPHRDDCGRVVGFVACVADVTELEGIHTALRDSELRYLDLFEQAPVAYISVGTDGRIEQANRRAEELFGYPKEQLIGQPIVSFHADTPEGKARARRIVESFRNGVEVQNEELELRRPDGSEYWACVSVTPMRNAAGKVVADRGTAIDITDRKLAEKALRESQQRLERLVDSAMDAIVTIDEHGVITLFNPAAVDGFRCAASEAIDRPFERFASVGLRQLLADCGRAFDRDSTRCRYVWAPAGLTAVRADGEDFPIEATISRFEMGGHRFYTIILRDVGDRARAEEELRKLRLENLYLQETAGADYGAEDVIGRSRAIRSVLDSARKVAATDSTVLITGETGTGKELVARAVHRHSKRAEKILIKVNCAALPVGVIESELFGHERGAFTGALSRRIGRFELADRSTIFLDEISDLPVELQAKLLRVLQEGEFERVGGKDTLSVDVRVIAATNRDLATEMREQRFRADLFYRLNVFPITVPPLRDRREDIPLLAQHFTMIYAARMGKRITRIPSERMEALAAYDWPGNVRELQNLIERAVIVSDGPDLELADLPAVSASPPDGGRIRTLEDVEREHILSVLQQTRWRVGGERGAARILGLKRTTLEARMKKLGVSKDPSAATER